jgi:hypothetical protein
MRAGTSRCSCNEVPAGHVAERLVLIHLRSSLSHPSPALRPPNLHHKTSEQQLPPLPSSKLPVADPLARSCFVSREGRGVGRPHAVNRVVRRRRPSPARPGDEPGASRRRSRCQLGVVGQRGGISPTCAGNISERKPMSAPNGNTPGLPMASGNDGLSWPHLVGRAAEDPGRARGSRDRTRAVSGDPRRGLEEASGERVGGGMLVEHCREQ